MHTDVAIIVGCYNQEEYVQQALYSAQNQILPYYARTNFFPTIQVIEHHDNCGGVGSGASASRNTAIEKADADWIFWLDADDFIPSNYIHHLWFHVFSGCSTNTISFSPAQFISGARLDSLRTIILQDYPDKIKFGRSANKYLKHIGFPIGMSGMFSKHAWEKLEGFDENLSNLTDLDFWFRASYMHASFRLNSQTQLFRRNIKKLPLGNTEEENVVNTAKAKASLKLFKAKHDVTITDLYLPYYIPSTNVF